MNWIAKLLSIDVPGGATLRSAELSLRGGLSWWIAILLFIAAGAGVFFLYSREQIQLHPVRRFIMALTRVVVIGLLLLFLLRPILIAEFHGERPRGVALLIDNSQSMTLHDQRLSSPDRLRVAIVENLVAPDTSIVETAALTNVPAEITNDPDRAHLVRSVLANPRLGLLPGLRKAGPINGYLFGQRLHGLTEQREAGKDAGQGDEKFLESFKADESKTAIADAVSDVLTRSEGDIPGAIVLMTDGRDNASKISLREIARECGRLQVPLHIYGAGSSASGHLQIKDVGAPETIFFDDSVAVPIRWRCQGFKEGTAEITLSLAGKEVARREVPVREGEDFRDVLTFTPQKTKEAEERLDLVARIKLKDARKISDETETKRPVRIIDRKVKVLYVEGAPRWEYKFIQTNLLRDRRVEASFLLVNGDPRALQAGRPFLPGFPTRREGLFAFDLLIIGDVPATYFGPEKLNWIRDFVREGGGLVLIAGKQNAPAGYVESVLAEVLPVEFQSIRPAPDVNARPEAYQPVLTRTGQRSDMLALADQQDDSLNIWKKLPGFYWNYPVTKLRPGAVSLLEHPKQKSAGKAMPLLAMHYYGKGLVLFSGIDETWRWRYNAEDKSFGRFWGQVVYQFGLPHLLGNPKRVQMTLERTENFLGRPTHVYARVFDADYRPLAGERIQARLEQLDAQPGTDRSQMISLEPIPGQSGDYRALLPHDATGRFELKIDSPETTTLEYRVGLPPQHELEAAGMAEDILREAARLSGGEFYREEDLYKLAGNIVPRSVEFVQRQEVLLWNPLTFLMFVVLVTVEWVLRKLSNLS